MGYDLLNRISFEKNEENFVYGIHLFTRLGNFLGLSDVECKEGNSNCVPNDRNNQTLVVRDIRTQKTETLALETNFRFEQILNLGLGGIYRRKYGGYAFDKLNPGTYADYEKDSFGKAAYGWLALSWKDFTLGFRHEYGTGNNGVFTTVQQDRKEFLNRVKIPSIGSRVDSLEFTTPNYQSKSYFIRKLFFFEYKSNSDLRFAISGSHLLNYDSQGEKEQVYIDYFGNERTKQEYLSQF